MVERVAAWTGDLLGDGGLAFSRRWLLGDQLLDQRTHRAYRSEEDMPCGTYGLHACLAHRGKQ